MHSFSRSDQRLVLTLAVVLGLMAGEVRAENLDDAWAIATGDERSSRPAGRRPSRPARSWPHRVPRGSPRSRRSMARRSSPTPSPYPAAAASPRPASGGQDQFTISAVAAIVPIYTGGRIKNTIASNTAQLCARASGRCDHCPGPEARGRPLLCGRAPRESRHRRAQSNVVNLTAQARDVENLVTQGRGIRNDLLAAQVARANAQQREIQAAQPAQHRLGDLQPLPLPTAGHRRSTGRTGAGTAPARERGDISSQDTLFLDHGTGHARRGTDPDPCRFRLEAPLRAGLVVRAGTFDPRPGRSRAAGTRPQVSFLAANLYQNVRFLPTEADSGAAAFVLNWTAYDGGKSRRHAMSLEQQAASSISRRDDLAAGIKLQVRSAWLTCQENQRRIPLTLAAIVQAEENLRVAHSRYIQQRGTNTEVLDAESARFRATTITSTLSTTPSAPILSSTAPWVISDFPLETHYREPERRPARRSRVSPIAQTTNPSATPPISSGGAARPATDRPSTSPATERQEAGHLDHQAHAAEDRTGGWSHRDLSMSARSLRRGVSSGLRCGVAQSPCAARDRAVHWPRGRFERLGRFIPDELSPQLVGDVAQGGRCWSSGGRSRCRRLAVPRDEAFEEVLDVRGLPFHTP